MSWASPLDDGRFADARLAHQHGVVLGAAAEHLHHPFNFGGTAHQRVEGAFAGALGEVDAELVEGGGFGVAAPAALRAGAGGVAQHLVSFGTHFVEGDAEAFQHAGGHAFAFPQQADEQVFGADVGMVHPAGFIHRQFDDLLGAGGEADFALGGLVAAADDEFDGGAHFGEVDGEAGQHPGGHAFGFANQAEQDMLGADVVMVEPLGLFLGQRQDPPGALGELLEPAAHLAAPGVGEVDAASVPAVAVFG